MKVDPQDLNTKLGRGMDAILAEFEGDAIWSRNARGDVECMSPSLHTLSASVIRTGASYILIPVPTRHASCP